MRAAIFAAVLTTSTLAVADDRAEADLHARRGTALYKLGKYDDSIVQFEAAYTLYQADTLLFNLAQAHRQLGHCERALSLYKRFLEGAPSPALADQVRSLLPKLEAACSTRIENPTGTVPATPAPEQGGSRSRGHRRDGERRPDDDRRTTITGRTTTTGGPGKLDARTPGTGALDGRGSTTTGPLDGRTPGTGAPEGRTATTTGSGSPEDPEDPSSAGDDGSSGDDRSPRGRVGTAGGAGDAGDDPAKVDGAAPARDAVIVRATAAATVGTVMANGTAPIAGIAAVVTTPPPWAHGVELGVAAGAARMWRADVDHDALVARLGATARYGAPFDWGRLTLGMELGALFVSSLDSSRGVVPGITRGGQWAPLVRGELGGEHEVARAFAVRAAIAVGASPRSGAMLSPMGELELMLGVRYER